LNCWQEWQGSNLRPPVLEIAELRFGEFGQYRPVRFGRIIRPVEPLMGRSSWSNFLRPDWVWVQNWVQDQRGAAGAVPGGRGRPIRCRARINKRSVRVETWHGPAGW
jgi:hypothetical protein